MPHKDPLQQKFNADTVVSLTSFELAMINHAVSTIVKDDDAYEKMKKLITDSKSVQDFLPNGVQVHIFVTIPVSASTNMEEALQLFPMKSDLFHESLVVSNPRSPSTSQALRDAFLVAKRNIEIVTHFNSGIQNSTQAVPRTRKGIANITATIPNERHSSTPFTLPDFFPYSPTRKPNNLPQERETEYIICRDDVISKLAALDSTSLSKIYSNIFNTIWKECVKFEKVTGQITYSKMTPP